MRRRNNLIILAAGALFLLAFHNLRQRRSAPLPEDNQPLSLLRLPTTSGPELDIAKLQGKVVVINFWSPG